MIVISSHPILDSYTRSHSEFDQVQSYSISNSHQHHPNLSDHQPPPSVFTGPTDSLPTSIKPTSTSTNPTIRQSVTDTYPTKTTNHQSSSDTTLASTNSNQSPVATAANNNTTNNRVSDHFNNNNNNNDPSHHHFLDPTFASTLNNQPIINTPDNQNNNNNRNNRISTISRAINLSVINSESHTNSPTSLQISNTVTSSESIERDPNHKDCPKINSVTRPLITGSCATFDSIDSTSISSPHQLYSSSSSSSQSSSSISSSQSPFSSFTHPATLALAGSSSLDRSPPSTPLYSIPPTSLGLVSLKSSPSKSEAHHPIPLPATVWLTISPAPELSFDDQSHSKLLSASSSSSPDLAYSASSSSSSPATALSQASPTDFGSTTCRPWCPTLQGLVQAETFLPLYAETYPVVRPTSSSSPTTPASLMQSNLSLSQNGSPHLPLTPSTAANASTSTTGCTTNLSEDGAFPEQEDHYANILDPHCRRKSQASELFYQASASSSCSNTGLAHNHSPSPSNPLLQPTQTNQQPNGIDPNHFLSFSSKPAAVQTPQATHNHPPEAVANSTVYSPLPYASDLGFQAPMKPEESDGRSSSSVDEDKPRTSSLLCGPLACQGPSSMRRSTLGLEINSPTPQISYQLPPHINPVTLAAVRAKIEIKHWEEDQTVYFQVVHNGSPVGRVRETGMVNGTKLLNLTRITRGKRDGILKNEKFRRVVKHGTMHLKGVWIAYERAVFLAEQYKISPLVFPLLEPDLDEYISLDPSSIGSRLPTEPAMILPSNRSSDPSLDTLQAKLAPLAIGNHRAMHSHRQQIHHPGFPRSSWSSPRPTHSPGLSYPEPCSAPPIPVGHGSQRGFYEAAHLHHLSGDLAERRHTVHTALEDYRSQLGPQFNMTYPPSLGGYSTAYNTPTTIEFPNYSVNPNQHQNHQQQPNHSISKSPLPALDSTLSKTPVKGFSPPEQPLQQQGQNPPTQDLLKDQTDPRMGHQFAGNLPSSMANKTQATSANLNGSTLYGSHSVTPTSPPSISPSIQSPSFNRPQPLPLTSQSQSSLNEQVHPFGHLNPNGTSQTGAYHPSTCPSSPTNKHVKMELDDSEDCRRFQVRSIQHDQPDVTGQSMALFSSFHR